MYLRPFYMNSRMEGEGKEGRSEERKLAAIMAKLLSATNATQPPLCLPDCLTASLPYRAKNAVCFPSTTAHHSNSRLSLAPAVSEGGTVTLGLPGLTWSECRGIATLHPVQSNLWNLFISFPPPLRSHSRGRESRPDWPPHDSTY